MFHGQHKDRSNLKVFDTAVLAEIQGMAQTGLQKDEILEGMSVDWDSLPQADKDAFQEHYSYGRLVGMRQMGDNLFMQARSKQGTAAALAFLSRFAKEWQREVAEAGGDTNFNFTMKI